MAAPAFFRALWGCMISGNALPPLRNGQRSLPPYTRLGRPLVAFAGVGAPLAGVRRCVAPAGLWGQPDKARAGLEHAQGEGDESHRSDGGCGAYRDHD